MWRTDPQKPEELGVGSRVAIVSPSWGGPAVFPDRYSAGKDLLVSMFGFEVVEMKHALAPPEWIYKHPSARAQDIMSAFSDPNIDGIIASIGGDDSIRLMPFLDLEVLSQNPKAFLGYSDTTALHFACLKAGIVPFHGPSVMSGFAENAEISATTKDGFSKVAQSPTPAGPLPFCHEGWTSEELDWAVLENQSRPRKRAKTDGPHVLRGSGKARGRLIGGCGEVLEMIKATAWWPPLDYWNNAILVFETSEEAPSEAMVLRWFRNLGCQGILQRLSGIALGRAGGSMTEAGRSAQRSSVLQALDEVGLNDLVVLADLDIGHTDPILTLPLGLMAEIDCDEATLSIEEAAVTARP